MSHNCRAAFPAVLLLLLVTLHWFGGFAAAPKMEPIARFKNFGTDALANAEVKASRIASDGSFWVATDKGLFVLNGGQFSEQELPANLNRNFNSLLEHKGYLYAGTNNGAMRINLTNRKAEALSVLKEQGMEVNKYTMVTDINSDGELLFYTGYDTSAYFQYNLQTQKTQFLFNKSDGYRALKKDANGKLVKFWAVESSGLLEHEMNGYHLKTLRRIFLGTNGQPLLHISNAALDSAGILWCSTDKGLLSYNTINHSYQIIELPGKTADINDVQTEGDRVFCATRTAGIWVFNKTSRSFAQQMAHVPDDAYSLAHNNVLKLYVSPQHILFAVTPKGVSSLPLDAKLQFTSQLNPGVLPGKVHLFQKDGGDYLLAAGLVVKRFSVDDEELASVKLPEPATAILPLSTSVVVVTASHLFVWSGSLLSSILPARNLQKARSLLFVTRLRGDSVLLAGGNEGLFEIDLVNKKYYPFSATVPDAYQQFQYAFTDGDALLVNTYFSYTKIFRRQANAYKVLAEAETFCNVYDHLRISEGRYLLAGSSGLGILETGNAKYTPVQPSFQQAVFKVLASPKDTLLITEQGLYRYWHEQILPAAYPFNTLLRPVSAQSFAVQAKGVEWWNGETLVRLPFETSGILQANPVWMNITSVPAIGGSHTQLAANSKWQVSAALNNYHPFAETGWQYQLWPTDSNWQSSETNHLVFDNLAPGNYTLKFRAFSGGRTWFSRSVTLSIEPAWYQTSVVKWLATFLLALFFYVLYRLNLSRYQRKANEKEAMRQRILELESKAFRAQMNPHFVFNTLNSINSCILEKETEKASDFLTRFSRLIRLTLENSQHDLIPLEKELETIRLYLSIEQKRLEDGFGFEVKTDQLLNEEEWAVPPMIIQPFVENSLWHGLVHKQPGGTIRITIMRKKELLQIRIEDNGIGREAAAKLKSAKQIHQSLGTTLTLQRLQVFHPDNQVSFTDLSHQNGQAAGTLVQINIYPVYK